MAATLGLLLLTLFGGSLAFLFDGDNKWNDLKVTWNINPLSSNAFVSMPRNVNHDAMGFVRLDSFCNGNQPKGPFAGIRYWKNNDPAVILLYDVNGIIAGIQTAVPKSSYPHVPPPNNGHPLLDDGAGNWVLTAYFVDPKTICNGGRNPGDLNTQGTGTGLYLQNGTDPMSNLIHVPMDEQKLATETKWTLGHCFYTMGDHYWYNVRRDMPCDQFFPVFLLYNSKKLNAFGWAMNTMLSSPRYEHPTYDVLTKFINPVPDCFKTDPNYQQLSTMHIYFTSELGDLC